MPIFNRIDARASQDRLERLIEDRLAPGADRAAIDALIWTLFGERWAVMFTDLIGLQLHLRYMSTSLKLRDYTLNGQDVALDDFEATLRTRGVALQASLGFRF